MPITPRIPRLVAVPTTAGPGSEATLWAVITDHERKIKFNVGGTPLIGAHVALVDPELRLALPPAITAATGMDALSHAIECYTCDYHQPFNDAVALLAIELVGRWLRVACEEGGNLEARTGMAHAATLGGLAYGTESAGAAHAMSQSAGGVHECPHGALTARVLGPVCEYNVRAAPELYARIAQGLGGGAEHARDRLLDVRGRRLGRERGRRADRGDEPGDRRDDRLRPRGDARRRTAGDRRGERGCARVGGSLGLRAGRGDGAGGRDHRGAP